MAPKIRERAGEFERQLMDKHRDGERDIMKEFLRTDRENEENILTTYINPGHTLECMWFVIHYALDVGQREIIEPAVKVVRRALELGWDRSYGGLYQFVHMEGGRPRGPITGNIEGHPMVEKLEDNWDAKLWWVHSEALYVLVLCNSLIQAPWMEEWYWKVHDYTFETFPAAEGEEWVNIRHLDGSPSDRVVALPVKDPFHVPRALMNAIRVLDEGVPL